MEIEKKRAQFTNEYLREQKRKRNKVLGSAFIISFLALSLFIWLNSGRFESPNSGNYFFGDIPNYDQKVTMTKIDLLIEDGFAKIPVVAVEENKLIYTEYKDGPSEKIYYGNLKVLPLTAFISSVGRLVVATSICEPCYGTEFTLESKELVCQTCFTKWRNTDLFGLSGGCVKYPPEELNYQIEGDYIIIPEEQLDNWKPRIFKDEMANEISFRTSRA